MAQKDYAEMLCEAVDIIVNEKIKTIQFDRTINCTIIDDSESLIGKYKVTDGSSKFYAYSISTDYKKNDAVYVTVPNGDFNNQKLITGKQISKNTSPYIFRTPFDTMVDVSTNLITEQINFDSIWLRANDPDETQILLWSQEYEGLAGYTRLGIQGSFRSWLESLNCVYGNYGYKLIVECQEENLHSDSASYQNAINKIKEVKEINEEILNYIYSSTGIKWTEEEWNNFISLENKLEYLENKKFNLNYNQYELYLDSQDMYGNPYDFESFYKQEKVFDISGIKQIIKLSLYFYQKPETFVDKDKNKIPYKDSVFTDSYLSPNLFTKDSYICLGYDIDTFEDDEATLYTLDSLTYTDKATVINNTKQIILRWVHKFDDRIKVVSKDTSLNYEIRWYQYALGSPSADEYSGVYWKRIENNEFYYKLNPNLSLEQEQIKVIILHEGKPIYSNILTFTNENEVPNQATIDTLAGLNIWCNDNTYGNYFVYDPGNKLLEQYNVKEAKRLSALFSVEAGLSNNKTSDSLLTEATSITWVFPTVKTMLQVEGIDYSTPYPSVNDNKFTICKPKTGIKSSSVEGICDIITYNMEDGSKIIYDNINKTLEITRYGNINNGFSIDATQLYFIKETYSQENSNNNVQCSIVKDNKTYFTAKSFQFGQAGTTGTDTTLRIYIDPSNEFAMDIQQPTLKLKAILYDSENKEIDLKNIANDKITFEWSWFCYSLGTALEPNIQIVPSVSSDLNNENNNLIIKNKIKNEKNELIDVITNYNNSSRNIVFIEDRTNTINMDQFLIVQCTVKNWGDYDLTTYKPIALKNGNKYSYVDCANEIIYSTTGYPNYYKDAWQIHLTNIDNDSDGNEDLANGEWEIFNPFNENVNFIGAFKDNILKPLGVYISNAKQYGAKCKIGTETIWTQPIICLQNNYPSLTLNQWNGKKIDPNDEGYILAPAIAAGKKNQDDTFSGVMLGDWHSIGATADDISKQTGVYGFHHGAMSYAFKEDGTAFIGKSGKGRILFNGNESTITSENYKQNKGGILIDLDDGFIDIKNSSNKVKVHLNSKGTSLNPYFSIFGTSKELIHISDAGYFLQTDDYGTGSGVKIDLNNGKITAYDFLISAAGTGGTLTINSGDNTYPFDVNGKFKIAWDGGVTATWGTVGGFTITDHSIFSGAFNKPTNFATAESIKIWDARTYWGASSHGALTYDFRLGNSLFYDGAARSNKGKLYLAANLYSYKIGDSDITNSSGLQDAAFIYGINVNNNLQIGSAKSNQYDDVNIYGGALKDETNIWINLIPSGVNSGDYSLKVSSSQLYVNPKITADNQHGIYARFA